MREATRTNPPGFILSVPVDNFVDKYRLSYGALWISLWITIVCVGLTLTNGLAIVIPDYLLLHNQPDRFYNTSQAITSMQPWDTIEDALRDAKLLDTTHIMLTHANTIAEKHHLKPLYASYGISGGYYLLRWYLPIYSDSERPPHAGHQVPLPICNDI